MRKLNWKKAERIRQQCFAFGDWIDIFKAFSFEYPHLTRNLIKDWIAKEGIKW